VAGYCAGMSSSTRGGLSCSLISAYKFETASAVFTTLAGLPIATEKSGMSLATTLPAPTITPFPIGVIERD